MERKILVVDDERPILDILKFNLEKEGFSVLTADNGLSALECALTQNPDLILLDIMLPKMDGFDVCRKIREKSNTPIIMITARDEEVDEFLIRAWRRRLYHEALFCSRIDSPCEGQYETRFIRQCNGK